MIFINFANMKTLFITPWYPTKYDAMSGLFVLRHAEAIITQGIDVHVLYICYNKAVLRPYYENTRNNGIKETIFYFPETRNPLTETHHLFNAWKYWHSRYGLPDIIHLNVLTKQILLPLYLKKRYGIPFVLTEHWSGYLPENGAFSRNRFRKFYGKAISQASAVMPVSDTLAQAMTAALPKQTKAPVTIPNVVSDIFYKASEEKACNATKKDKGKFVFLHVSCFDNDAKNTAGIIEAAKKLYSLRHDFSIIMVGTGPDFGSTKALASDGKLTENGTIRFTGELQTAQVAEEMSHADAFILFSNYETAAVVLQEASVMKLPIISTPVGIAPNIISPITGIIDNDIRISDNGILIPVKNSETLCKAMNYMIEHRGSFSYRNIPTHDDDYTLNHIGKRISDIYHKIVK